MTDTLTITVIEPEELAPVGRLGEWLFAEGAALRMVRPWRGEPIPSLDEIGDLLEHEDGSHCTEAREQAERKLADVRAKLADLHRIEAVLEDLVQRCCAALGQVRCPMIQALQET